MNINATVSIHPFYIPAETLPHGCQDREKPGFRRERDLSQLIEAAESDSSYMDPKNEIESPSAEEARAGYEMFASYPGKAT